MDFFDGFHEKWLSKPKHKLGGILSMKHFATYETLAKNSYAMLLRFVFLLFLQYILNHMNLAAMKLGSGTVYLSCLPSEQFHAVEFDFI